MTKPGPLDLVSLEASLSYQRNRVMVHVRRSWYESNTTKKHPGKTRVFIVNFDVPLVDEDLVKILASALLFCGDPNKRHLKPPRARFWREAGTELPVPPGGGEGGEDSPPDMDPLPLPGGFPQSGNTSTLQSGPEVEGEKSAVGGSASSSEAAPKRPARPRKSKVDAA